MDNELTDWQAALMRARKGEEREESDAARKRTVAVVEAASAATVASLRPGTRLLVQRRGLAGAQQQRKRSG